MVQCQFRSRHWPGRRHPPQGSVIAQVVTQDAPEAALSLRVTFQPTTATALGGPFLARLFGRYTLQFSQLLFAVSTGQRDLNLSAAPSRQIQPEASIILRLVTNQRILDSHTSSAAPP